jgi:alpha-beta hydrolase superfamily lysophospholipase
MKKETPKLEVHLVAHSAGSILFGYLFDALLERSMTVDSCTLYAPACTVQFALDHYEPAMTTGVLRKQDFHVEILSDERELGDTVGPYGKSLLYLVSRALEDQHKTPILGMASAWDPAKRNMWSDDPVIQRGLKAWQTSWGSVRAPREVTEAQISNGVTRIPSAHGAFDNDVTVVTRTIERIAGKPLKYPVEQLVY